MTCNMASGSTKWIPASAGMGVGVCAGVHHHAGLDPASIIMSRCPGQLTAPMDSCFRRNGSGSVRKNGGRRHHHHAGLDPASIIMSRCPGQLTAPMDSCFRRNGNGNGFLLPQEWEWDGFLLSQEWVLTGFLLSQEWVLISWIPAFAGMGAAGMVC